MFRVLFTINNLRTAGMKFVIADLVERLDRSRFAPAVAVNQLTDSPLERRLKEACPIYHCSLRVPRRPRVLFPFRLWRVASQLRGVADVAHSFDYASDWSEGKAMQLAGIPWVAEKTNLLWDPVKWRRKCSLARRIVCLSEAQRGQMTEYQDKVEVIPTGIDVNRFAGAEPFEREVFGLGAGDLVLVCVAHLIEVKGHRELIRAFREVHGEHPTLKLVLAGEGESHYADELHKMVESLGLMDHVRFLGKVDDVPRLLKMADGKILPTRNSARREGFGAAIVEAMAASLPVIATRSGGPEEIVIPDQTGWLVDAEGEAPMVEAMKEFCASPEKRTTYGRAGFVRAAREYSVELMVERLGRVYESVAAL